MPQDFCSGNWFKSGFGGGNVVKKSAIKKIINAEIEVYKMHNQIQIYIFV